MRSEMRLLDKLETFAVATCIKTLFLLLKRFLEIVSDDSGCTDIPPFCEVEG